MFNKEQLQRFSIRKLTVGAASVLIGVLFLTSWNTNTVYADSINGESIAKNNNPQEGNPAVNKDNVQIVDNDSTEVSNISDSKSSKVIKSDATKSDATKSDIVRDKTTIDDNSGTTELTAQANNKQALTTVTEDNGAKVSKTEKYSNSDIKKQPKNSEETQETTLVKKVLDKEKLSSESLIEEKLSSESLIDPKKLDEKVEIRATDPSNYPTEKNGLIGEDKYIYQVLSDKYIYQVLSLDGGSKLILSVNRKDHNDTNIYAYVIDGNYNYYDGNYNYYDGNYDYNSVEKPIIIGKDESSIITIDGRKYRLNNNGSSEVFIDGKDGNKVVSTQNSSTVTSQPGLDPRLYPGLPRRYYDNTPIGQVYGLGNTSKDKCTDIGEIVPVFTENSVIKYYYSDNEGNLTEIENSPNVIVDGFTGQEFEIKDVDQYKKVIQGYYLTSDNLPTGDSFKGTLSQFSDDKYYKKVYYDFKTNTVEYSVLYHQISPDGKMEVWLFDDNGYPLTKSRVIAPNGSYNFSKYNVTVRNPYVTAAPHEVQFIYKKLGSIIPVDENGKHIGDPIQFKNDPTLPTKALPGIVPSISGYTPLYKHVGEKVYPNPTDPGENIEVVYRANAQTAKITYIDDTTKNNLDSKDANGKFGQAITFATAPTDEIANYKKQGYVLVSNSFNNNKYQADNSKNVFYVHLKHKTENVTRNDTVTRTIHYLYDNGNTAQPDKTQTVSFNETGTKDDVTGKTTWDNDNAQTVGSVITPSITGYTPDQLSVEKQAFKFGDKDVEVTVTYNANAQTATITYIDDTDKKTLGSDSQNGKFNQAITFEHDPAAKIASYEKQGYVLVSNSFNNNKYQADDNNNVFYVHLKHGTKKVSRNDDVNMTVHYVMDDDSKAPSDNKQTVNFTEDGIQDLVTQKITWTPADSQTLNDVVSPVLTGYTADIKTANGKVVNFDDPDINVTVHYSANAQTAKITYIDDTTKNTLDSKDASGKFGQAITFTTSPTDEIANYKKQGYVLVSNSFDNNKYQADDNNNVFYVHLKHGTKKVSRNDDVNMTVHYVMDDNSEAPSDNKQSLSFTENGIQDLVTKKIAWTPVDSQTFKDVVTPKMTGYTPDQDSVTGQTVNFGDNDINVTVHYSANAQTAKITYIDDTTKTNLDSKDASGKFGQAIAFATAPSDEIANYKKQGYVLVSNSFNNQTYAADNNNNVFYVHLEHKTESVTRNDTVTRTIHYLYDNGNTAQPDKTQTVSFNETGTKDDVTGETTWDNDNAQTVDSVITPSITGYTPDKSSIEKQSFKFGDQDVEVTVTYNANAQTATITYIDDTDKKTLGSDSQNGKFNQAITFEHDPAAKIASYEKQGYVLVSNSFNNNKYQADDNNNVFYVHLKHGTKNVSRNDDVNMTVHYVMDDGSVAPSDNKQTVNFTENGIQDLVTQKITWTPADSQKFDDVDSPVLTGYTADIKTANGKVVNFGDPDINVIVHYSANAQTAKITYIDDTTKNTLDSKDANGKFGQAITFATAPSDEIANYKKQGYVLVSNSFDNNKYQADDNNNVFYVHLKHGTKKVSRNDDVNMTVHYVMDDDSVAPSDNKQTVNFTEDGIQDLVTQKITWTPAESQTLKDVDSPVLTGYTADIKTAKGKVVNFDDPDINVTVHYSANAQTAKITYIDDTTKTNLDSKDAKGKFGQAIAFATAPSDEIANYKKQGYVLVSNSFDNNKYQADDNNNVFYVHLKHDTKKVSRNDDVNMTVHYVMDDNSEAPSDNKQTVNFTEDGIQDLVTQKITWTPADSQKFDDVASPVLTGYTANIKTANGKAVNFGDPNINVTVHYSANAQTATITYIDDTTKNTLDSKDANGKFGQAITFATAPSDEIANYKKQGYKLVSNDFNDNKYQADNNKNVFYVHFVHDTKTVNREHSASFTVHYIYKDGGQAKPDHEQTLSFTENGSQDLVTQKITWTPADSQKFDDVATPVITGYTPDHDKVIGQTANFETDNREVTVTYLPDVQLGHINYIDDNTGKTLTRDDFSGRTNEHEDYTPIDRIQEFENKGYVFVSSDYPDGGFNFDDNDQQEQVFNVHLKHGIVTVTSKKPQTPNMPIDPDPHSPKYPKDISNTNSDVKRTIDYKFKDGKTAQPTVNDSLHFERTVVIDKVTGDVLSDTWTPSQDFNDVQTPVIQGYTPDRTVVSDKNIGHDHQNIVEHVIYSPDAQHMTITYVDDTTHETLKQDKLDGTSDQDAKYTTSNSINHYTDLHYKMVSDSTNGQDLIFDHDDKADQTYEVHFVHGTHTINQTISPKQTVHYVYADDLARHGNAADDNVQQLSFKRDGYNDEVTGIDHWNAWTPANSQYKAVNSPVIQGYTPDKSVIEKSTVNPTDKDTEITVVYNADKQTAHVIYIDKTTNDTLTSNDLSGESDKDSGYNTKDTIGKYESQHYVLTGDETNGDNVIFDHDDKQDQTYYVYFVHGTQKVNRQDTVTSTIDYKFEDGKTAQPTVTQTKHFSEDGVKDLVTGKIVWDETESQKFDNIATKSIVGYTPDKDNVTGSTVNFGDSDIEVTVTYHNNAQKAVITYVDDVTKKTLASDSQDGKFDHEITFEHDPAEVINSLKEKGYKLVSNDFKDGTKYKADDKQNEFIVHLTHDKQKVNRQDQVVETIHYVYENGSKSQPDHEQTISFTEDGVKDKVTDQIDWTSATPQKFDDVATPTIVGYTPDKDNVTGSTVKFGDEDVEVTVTYHNNAQTATITYIDDTENKTLGSDKQNGKFNQAIIFEHDPAEVIKGLEEKGYKLVSDNFKPGIKYQNDNKFNIFEVHLVHTSEPVETSQTITETVHYIDANGKPVAPDHVAKVVIKVTGTRDKVTDSIIWNTPSTGHFDEVISPEVPNMTPDKKLIPGLDVQYGDSDITESVVYTPDNSTSKTPEKPDKPSKEVSKAPEKSIDSRTVDNHVSAKSTAKRELPQTGATTNTGIWTGLVSMIASLGLLGASKRRKKN